MAKRLWARRLSGLVLAAAGAAALSACSGEKSSYSAAEPGVVSRDAAYAGAAETAMPPGPPPAEPGAQGGVMLAYSYSMGISAPKQHVEPLAKAHEKACMDAGLAVCQVLGASINVYGEDRDQVSGYLNIRAEPKWLAGFRATVAGDAEKFGGKLVSDTVNTEDLTAFIVDMDARLAAKKALRERIRALLETREGSLNDVLAAERALADVQGEIDSMTASLEAARARVAMSSLTISYASDPETSIGVFKPLADAFGDFGRTSVRSLAEAVNFIARAWPFFVLALVVLAILRIWLRGRRKG